MLRNHVQQKKIRAQSTDWKPVPINQKANGRQGLKAVLPQDKLPQPHLKVFSYTRTPG